MRDEAECFCPGDLFLDLGILKDPRPLYGKPRRWWGRGQSALVLVGISVLSVRCWDAAQQEVLQAIAQAPGPWCPPSPVTGTGGIGLWNPSTWGPPGLVLVGTNLGPKSSILSGWPPKLSICPRATSSLRTLLPWAQGPCSVTAPVLWVFSVGSHTDANVCGAENKHGTVKAELLKPLNPRTHLPVKLFWPL